MLHIMENKNAQNQENPKEDSESCMNKEGSLFLFL